MTDITLATRERSQILPLLWREATKVLAIWRQRSRQRHELARMPYREMADIGLSADARNREVTKPFWRA